MVGKCTSLCGRVCQAAGLTLLTGLALRAADIVHLKNGRSVEGLIREETDRFVTLDLGAGSMKVPRSGILRIERGDDEARTRTREAWQERHWLHVKHVPAGFEALAARMRALMAERQAVIRLQDAAGKEEADVRRMDERMQALQTRMAEVARELETLTPAADAARYNARVVEHNRINADLALLSSQREAQDKRRNDALARIHAYRDMALAFRADYAEQAKRSASESGARFLARLAKRLEAFESEFSAEDIKAEQEPGGLVVTAVINGRTHGRFIVDTGAGMVTLTEAFADKLGLDWRRAPAGRATLADGQVVEARYLTLASVQVGGMRVADVQAAVLPSTAQQNVDGLLGMSFLRHFHVSLDGRTGRIVLREFAPR